ncbi:MAG: hypothetical protein N3C62_00685 [Synergistetes bacterium]|nr:hypothetical protein [Synergistota bacterium]MCX8127254.1 hypothetical protein [Synergistota bacterium]MDW8191860.1 hypothetical protein [Synergistota bacterium]
MGFKEAVLDLERKIDRFFKSNNVIIFGASSGGRQVMEILKFLNKRPTFFVDNDQNKWGMEIDGIKVMSPEELKRLNPDIIVIGSTIYESEMIEQVERYGLGDKVVVRDFLEILVVIKALVRIFRSFEKHAFESE